MRACNMGPHGCPSSSAVRPARTRRRSCCWVVALLLRRGAPAAGLLLLHLAGGPAPRWLLHLAGCCCCFCLVLLLARCCCCAVCAALCCCFGCWGCSDGTSRAAHARAVFGGFYVSLRRALQVLTFATCGRACLGSSPPGAAFIACEGTLDVRACPRARLTLVVSWTPSLLSLLFPLDSPAARRAAPLTVASSCVALLAGSSRLHRHLVSSYTTSARRPSR
jgi:hypothetical protein